ncbi:aspartate aminotransferase family protein [Candidatus Aciduliprofundum boonei]|uniref:Ornithine aminotransferase n=1 Tax=Aciduliprofundum boonei (strain DSM 19572 / T469) TaxID=439481 RepID=B5ICS0_ACIB4|nr:aspartate aminotransferase family protein [Candidatus Aciduliprofundum boonei]ADD09152.1 aminotransferase class-III [Aciduliprofundum boonei T469]EDY36026.1 aminotransferase, class III superfamily [Aciduliprofundum boonei T469]
MEGPKIKVVPPGPKSQEILKLKDKYVARGMSVAHPIVVERAHGAFVEDVDGNVYIDFAGGIGVINAGHTPDEVVEAIKEQSEKLLHTCFMVLPYEPFLHLAERMVQITPANLEKVALFNSGAEAVENAIKIAIYSTGKQGIITFDHAFHGRTRMGMTLTGKNKPYKYKLGMPIPGIWQLPYPYPYRCMGGKKTDPEECLQRTLEYIDFKLRTHISPDETAAFIAEPLQGEGGFIVPPKGFFPELKKIAEENEMLLIDDEIQSGFGRTGKMWATEHFGTEPHIMTFAKSVASGLPLSGVIGEAEIMDSVHPGGLGGTYGGNPVACAAALKTIDIIEKNLDNAVKIGDIIHKRFIDMQDEFKIIGDVRGLGPMIAMELVKDRETQEPATEETKKILHKALEKGLILIKAGLFSNVIRILVPIVASIDTVEKGLDIFEDTIKEISQQI